MKSNRLYDITGSPGCYSTGKSERAHQLGLNSENEESFEGNQSFPRAHHHVTTKKLDTPDINKLKKFGLSSVNFLKQNLLKNHNNSVVFKNNLLNTTQNNRFDYSTHNNTTHFHNTSHYFDKSWAFYNQFAHSEANNVNIDQLEAPIVAVTNPNKALVIINGRTTEILTANNISCDLFGLNEASLIGRKLKDLFDFSSELSSGNSRKQYFLMESDRLDENGKIVLCSGKIFDAFTNLSEENFQDDCQNEKTVMPVSIYMLKLTDEAEPKCLCAMEPVQRVTGTFAINVKGQIRYYNSKFSYIFGFTNLSENEQVAVKVPSSLANIASKSVLKGKDITELIPYMKLPMGNIPDEIKKQTLTGRTWKGENIPLKISITNKQVFNNEEIVYNCIVSVYTNISGLITVDPTDLKINSCNPTFARLLFGYDEKDLINKPITFLLPNFLSAESTNNITTANNTRLNTTHKMTPLGVNNSYLNGNDLNPKNNNSLRYQATSGAIKSTHTISQANGSFIESPSTPTRKNQQPKIVIDAPSETENKYKITASKCCTSCGDTQVTSNLLDDFNLDYSPNKKCAKFIETNTFLPCSPGPNLAEQNPNVFNSAKKSLLAKAISNNTLANEVKRFSIDDDLASSTTSLSPSSSITSLTTDDLQSSTNTTPGKKLNKSRSFSNMNVSEFESVSLSPAPKCSDCTEQKRKGLLNTQNDNDTSVVSLIATDNNDISIEEEVDFMHDQVEQEDECLTIKPKTTVKRARLSDNINVADTVNEENRRSSMLLDADYNEKNKKFKNQVTSTPAASAPISNCNNLPNTLGKSSKRNSLANQSVFNINDGIFFGRGRHNDGSFLRIFYHRKLVHINNTDEKSKDLICVWISRDPYSDKSILDFSMEQSMFKTKKLNQTINDANAYSLEYEDILCLGRGASGFVELAQRRLDKFEVVTKYILKSKIYKENWIEDHKYAYGKIPLECSILCKLDHANIIKVLDVFQDEDFVHMIMEKHGCGMDLFEFIDRQCKYIEEPLACHIFKQIMSAVNYMHTNNLVHRDIKDENIVINQNFHIKLIDFGSTAYIMKGKKFATFCGTLDYCSPDVLLGNKYYGPELDVWTCGIALYTLIFSENPFVDAEETIECILKPPFKVSNDLMKLLFSILCANPDLRATVSQILADEWVNQPVDMSNYKWEEVIRNTEFHANTAGDIFRGDEDTDCVHADKENKIKNEQCIRLEKVDKYNTDNENQCMDTVDTSSFNSKLNQIAIMSKSF